MLISVTGVERLILATRNQLPATHISMILSKDSVFLTNVFNIGNLHVIQSARGVGFTPFKGIPILHGFL